MVCNVDEVVTHDGDVKPDLTFKTQFIGGACNAEELFESKPWRGGLQHHQDTQVVHLKNLST